LNSTVNGVGRAAVLCDFGIQEISDSTKSSIPYPLFLPVTYQVRDADYFLLKEAGQDIMRNSSMQSHTQPFVVLQAGSLPVINVSYGPLYTKREIPLDLVQLVQLFRPSPPVFTLNWKVQSFVLTRWVYSSSPKVRVLFYMLPCVTVYTFWQTQEVRGSCVIRNEHGTCMAEVDPPAGWFSPVEESSSRERQGPTQGNPVELYYQARPSTYGPCTASGEEGKRWDMGAGNAGQPQAEYMPVSVLRLREAVVIQTTSKPLKKTDIASFYVYVRSSANLDTFSLSIWCEVFNGTFFFRLNKLQAVLQMDFEMEDVSSQSEIQVIKWELTLPDEVKMMGSSEGTMRIYTTQRDFVGLAPLVMDTELLNTAVLTGKRVTVGVRTIAVEQDGSVTDVSEFADCSSTDEDVLKVSDRCDFVYVNGKETQGRLRMLVNFTYSYLSAQLEMKVWFPRLPLDIEVSDIELSQIKSWRIPILSTKSCYQNRGLIINNQVSPIVQVLSPLSDSILAEKTVRVVDDRVTITELGLQLVSGLTLSLQLSTGSNRAISATATTQEEAVLSSWLQFSDGSLTPLDIYDPTHYRLAVTSLDEGVISVQDSPMTIVAEGEGQGTLVRAEMSICEVCQKSKRKSTLAVGTGSLTVKFQTNSKHPENSNNSSERGDKGEEADSEKKLQQPEQVSSRNSESELEERALMKIITTARSTARDSTVGRKAGNDGRTGISWNSNEGPLSNRPLTDLEIGMYALLGVFCLAIIVFMVNCVSYLVKFRHKQTPGQVSEQTGHRHDWVWLGTDAELVMNVTGSPLQQDAHNTSVIDIGPNTEPCGTLTQRTSCQVSSVSNDSNVSCVGSPKAKPVRSESLHSPTSKRKRVQFTTFTSLDRQTPPKTLPQENGYGINWVGKEDIFIGEFKDLVNCHSFYKAKNVHGFRAPLMYVYILPL
uniref:Transmembrane protein 132D n=1 Tax=Sinocyclocheilus grahami TaxID=75366 RepID=A0A672S680_SINGR